MLDKLQKIAERLAEVERQLADPAVYSDRQAMTKLSREQKELTPVVEAYRAYSRAEADIAAATDMLSDPELRELGQEELTAAKEAIASSLRAVLDSPGAVESFHSTAALSGMIFTREEYLQAVERVSVADVARCAKTLKLHSTYFLKGESL